MINPYLVLFLDSGFARPWDPITPPTKDQWQKFRGIHTSDLRHTAGVSVVADDGDWRLSVARELNAVQADWRFELRLQTSL